MPTTSTPSNELIAVVAAISLAAILTGCNVTTRPDGTVAPPASTRPDAR